MGASYSNPEQSMVEALEGAMVYHEERLEGVKIKKDGTRTGPAIKVHGVAALAMVRIVNLRDRVAGLGDAMIIVDGDRWDAQGEAGQIALLDHELTHMRTHDHTFGWFDEVAARHPLHAPEVRQARELLESDVGELYLPGLAPPKSSSPVRRNPTLRPRGRA